MQTGQGARDPGAELVLHGRRLQPGQGGVQAESGGGGGDLGAEHSVADDDDPFRLPQCVTERERLVESAQDVQAQQALLSGEPPRAQAGGQYDGVRAHRAPGCGAYGADFGVEADGRIAE